MQEIPHNEYPWFKEYEFDSLTDFINWRYKNGIDDSASPIEGMVFRGVGCANSYKLIPSAFRKNKSKSLNVISYNPSLKGCPGISSPTIFEIIKAEIAELTTFYAESNKNGLSLPDVDYIKNNMFVKYHIRLTESLDEWPTSEFLELIALAQHYGMPTRMLDWTFNYDVALYFALNDVVRNKHNSKAKAKNEPFAVWGVKPSFIQSDVNDIYFHNCPIKFYVPIYANNPNLNAQEGILSYYYERDLLSTDLYKKYTIKPLDKVLNEYCQSIQHTMSNFNSYGTLLCKMIFKSKNPVDEFEYLVKKGINASKLFPGYKGVVLKLEEDEIIETLHSKGIH